LARRVRKVYPIALHWPESIVTIAVSITDKGDYVETVTATLAAANTITITIGTLNRLVWAGSTVIYYFYWNTTKIKPAWYGMSVTITSLAGETFGNVADNSFNNTNQIHVLPRPTARRH